MGSYNSGKGRLPPGQGKYRNQRKGRGEMRLSSFPVTAPVCVCVCVCKTLWSLGYYPNTTYVLTPVSMTSNEFFIAVCVYVDINMLL